MKKIYLYKELLVQNEMKFNQTFSIRKDLSFKINILENDPRGNLFGSLEGKVLSSKVKLNFSYIEDMKYI